MQAVRLWLFSERGAAVAIGASALVAVADGSGTPILADLINTLPVNQRYTYVFDGLSEVLDHILLTRGVDDFQYEVIHVNAEYSDQASDHDPQVVRIKP